MVDLMNHTQPHWQLFALLSGIYIKSRRISEEQLKPLGVTWPQFGALLTLAQEDSITQTTLAERMENDTNTTMVLCNSLERKGWILRKKNPSDKRSNLIHLTSEGRTVFQQAYPLILENYALFTDSITDEEIQKISPILANLYAKIGERYKETRK